MLTEFSSRPNPRYIYLSGFISSSLFQNTKRFLQIQSLAPGIACRSSGQFQLRRQLRWAITLNPCIVSRIRGYRCVRLSSRASSQRVRFVDWIPESPAIDGFLLDSGEGLLPRWEPPLLYLGFLRFPIRAEPLSLSPHLPRRRRPSPLRFPSPAAPFSPSPAAAVAGGGARAPAPRARACPSLRRQWPRPPRSA
jgi:hypothetical protein